MPVRFHHIEQSGAQRFLWLDEVSHVAVEGDSARSGYTMRECRENICVEVESYQLKSILADAIINGFEIIDVEDLDARILKLLVY